MPRHLVAQRKEWGDVGKVLRKDSHCMGWRGRGAETCSGKGGGSRYPTSHGFPGSNSGSKEREEDGRCKDRNPTNSGGRN